MKSKHELEFQNLIIKSIETTYQDAQERYKLLKEFFENEKKYYEIFCDIIYLHTEKKDEKSYKVFFEGGGVPHVVDESESIPEDGYLVFTTNDIVPDVEDIIVYIEIALKRLKAIIDK